MIALVNLLHIVTWEERPKKTLDKTIGVSSEHNDTSQIIVIMVDNNLTEIFVHESKIPDVHIQICSFHVLKYLKTKLSKLDLKQDQSQNLSSYFIKYSTLMIKKCILNGVIGFVMNLIAFQSISIITGIAVEKSGLGATRKC